MFHKIDGTEWQLCITEDEFMRIKCGDWFARCDYGPPQIITDKQTAECVSYNRLIFKGVSHHHPRGDIEWSLVCVEGDLETYLHNLRERADWRKQVLGL